MIALALLLLAQETTDFTLTVDGKPWTPDWIPLRGRARSPREGDLLSGPLECLFPLGPERSVRLRTTPEEDGRVLLERDGLPPRTIAARVSWTRGEDGDLVFRSPFAKMSDEEIRDVRGVTMNYWTPEILRDLGRLDGSRLAVNLHLMAPIRTTVPFPAMPAGLRYLRIWDGNQHVKDLSMLAELRDLRLLDIDISVPLDLRLLNGMKKLEWLRLGSREVTNLDALGELSGLKVLRLSWMRELSDVSFAKKLGALEEIHLERTAVEDLSPLGGLPELRVIRANDSKAKVLPRGELPAIQELHILSTDVAPADVEAFSKAHPACRISHRWNAALHAELEDVTSFRIREGGLCHRRGGEKTLFETKDPAILGKFAALLDVEEDKSGRHCMCCGEPSMEFYRGKELKVEIGFHHGSALRWKGWPGDGRLRPEAADALIRLMAAHGADGPLRGIEAAAEYAKAQERLLLRALAGLAPATVEAYRTDQKAFKAALEKERPDPRERAEALLRMLGTSSDGWWSEDPLEQRARGLLDELDQKTLAPAVEAALTGSDRRMRRGAARFWRVGNGPFSKWTPPDDSPVWEAVVATQAEQRFYPLRQEALKNLARWRGRLPAGVVDVRLAAGLRDPEVGVRRQALLTAGELRHEASGGHLIDVLAGKAVDPIALPPVPEEEERLTLEQVSDDVPANPEAEFAALALGYLNHAGARAALTEKAALAPAYAVALALLGEPERLVRAHFDGSTRNTDLQLAAVEAVVRCKGRRGLAEAVGYQQTRFWWERERVTQKLRDMLLAEDAPGKELLPPMKDLKPLQAWYKAHGARYLERFK